MSGTPQASTHPGCLRAPAHAPAPASGGRPANRGRQAGAAFLGLLGLSALMGCSADGRPCDAGGYAKATGAVVHVSARCGDDGGDGSAASPFATIAAAIKRSQPGTTVLVAPGSYVEAIELANGVHLVGTGSNAVALLPPADRRGVDIRAGVAITHVAGLRIEGASGFGVGGTDVALALTDVAVSGTKAHPTLGPGYGVAAKGAPTLLVESCQIADNAGIGVAAFSSGPVSIIDPIFDGAAVAGGVDAAAIIDPIFKPSSQIHGNAGGGIAIIDPIFAPAGKTDTANVALTLTATDVRGNKGYGVGLFGASARLVRCALRGTAADATGEVADGLVLAAGADAKAPGDVTFDAGSIVANNDRAGVLVATAAAINVSGAVIGNAYGGLWAQGQSATLRLQEGARVRDNALVGAAVTAGAQLEAKGARIDATRTRSYSPVGGGAPAEIGDGVGVFAGAAADISGCQFRDNVRAAVIGHKVGVDGAGVARLQVKGSTFAKSLFGIAVNADGSAGVEAASLKGGNTFAADIGAAVDIAATLAVRVSPCGDGAVATACAP